MWIRIAFGTAEQKSRWNISQSHQKVVVVEPLIINRGFYCSGESIKNGDSRIKSIMSDSHINQQVLACQKYSLEKRVFFSVAIFNGAAVVGSFSHSVVQGHVLSRCRQGEKLKYLASVKYMDVV